MRISRDVALSRMVFDLLIGHGLETDGCAPTAGERQDEAVAGRYIAAFNSHTVRIILIIGVRAVAIDLGFIRPAIQADQGDIFLRGVDEESGVVSVELVGACVGCPASTQTLKAGIERIMRDRVDGVTEVVNIAEAAA